MGLNFLPLVQSFNHLISLQSANAIKVLAVILVIEIAGTLYFGSIDVNQVVKNNVNPQTGLPNAVTGIPPAQAQVIFEIPHIHRLIRIGIRDCYPLYTS